MVENIRVSAFGGSAKIEFPNYRALTGKKPVQEARSNGKQFATAPFGGGQFLIGSMPGNRQDFIYGPAQDSTAATVVNIGTWTPKDLSKFRSAISAWLGSAPKIQRLAFGLVLMRPVASADEAMDLIRRRLDFVPTSISSTDFAIQFNEETKLNRMTINHLQKFAVAKIQVLTIVTGDGASAALDTAPVVEVLRYEIDVNTPAEQKVRLSAKQLETIFETLWTDGTSRASQMVNL